LREGRVLDAADAAVVGETKAWLSKAGRDLGAVF
jgi:hypothetical protein